MKNSKYGKTVRNLGVATLIGTLMIGALSGCGVGTIATTSGENTNKYDFKLYGDDKEKTEEAGDDISKASESDSTDNAKKEPSTFSESDSEVMKKASEIESYIDKYFYFDQDDEKREEGYYDGIMEGLDDPYSVYYTPSEYKRMMEDDSGSFEGIGATVAKDMNKGTIYIVKPIEDSPAEKAGILPDDVIVQVDDLEVTTDMQLDYVVDHMRGPEGTKVKLKVFREGEDDFLDITITRAKIENKTVEYEMLDDNIGYISVEEFIENTPELYQQAVDDLMGQGAKGLVIDVRNNPGGYVTAVSQMVDYMLDDNAVAKGGTKPGLLISTKDKNGMVMDEVICDDGHSVDIPMVVLINGNSASASEIFSGCLRDYGKAKLVGTTSYGKGIVQVVKQLSDGSAIKLTIAKYFLPSGADIHKKGVEPDVEVELKDSLKRKVTISHDEDNQLQEALKQFK